MLVGKLFHHYSKENACMKSILSRTILAAKDFHPVTTYLFILPETKELKISTSNINISGTFKQVTVTSLVKHEIIDVNLQGAQYHKDMSA